MSCELKIGLIQAQSENDLDMFKPLFFGYLKAYVDQYVEQPIFISYLEHLDDLSDFNIIGVSCTSQCLSIAKQIGRKVKASNRGIITIIGGHHITYMPETLPDEYDIGVLGEGEETFLELAQYFQQNGLVIKPDILKNIMGIVFHDNGNLYITPRRELIEPLDRIPFPDRSNEPYPYLFTSRGCPYKCTFCSSSAFWRCTRYFSAEYVIKEIEALITRYPYLQTLAILDDLFVGDTNRFNRFIELAEEKKINEKINFGLSVRANLVDDELCLKLQRMNVSVVAMGLESGSDRILKLLRKGTTVALNQKALDTFSKYRIPLRGYFIIGVPTETEEEVRSTYEFIIRNIIDDKLMPGCSINILAPLPGTEIWDNAIKEGLIHPETMNWQRLAYFASYRDSKFSSFKEWVSARKQNRSIYLAESTLPESRLYEFMYIYENAIKALEAYRIQQKKLSDLQKLNAEYIGHRDEILDVNRKCLQQMEQQKKDCDSQIRQLEMQNTQLNQMIQNILNSKSWKLTKPLRFLASRNKMT